MTTDRTELPVAPAWCPGCGNFSILKTFERAVEAAAIDRKI